MADHITARDFAIQAHGDQLYGDRPYVEHLDAVAAVVRSWSFMGPIEEAAYLHDVVEDTDYTVADLEDRFGPLTAGAIWACTGEGETRAERMAAIYAKCAKNGRGAVVKLADRTANLEACQPGDRHAKRYLGEHQSFREHIKPFVPAFCWDRYVTAVSRAMGGEG